METSQSNINSAKSEILKKTRSSYVKLACTSCRNKKTKWSGKAICENCKLHNRKCIYVKSNKKRGHKSNLLIAS
ncbi:8678_t:CDS:1, partial [Gigaspora margarita]